ncbi:MAG: coproporphyrinogen III oxidase, partial [Draconibacterium sp.]
VFSLREIKTIIDFLREQMLFSDTAEITIEANPDDLTTGYLKGLLDTGVNRLSMGIQSFNDELLKKMNRRHNASQAIKAVEEAEKSGFKNLSIDLIYGLPGLNSKKWKESLLVAYAMPVQHLSAYHLTYHKGTPFYTWLKKGVIHPVSEKESISQFDILIDSSVEAGFEQYEISNFARENCYSRHNTSYWNDVKYLGLGPSAHSYNGRSRRWNIASTTNYINAIEKGLTFSDYEVLTENERFNEYILTRLRTKWGILIEEMEELFGQLKTNYLLEQTKNFAEKNLLNIEKGAIILSRKGMLISDDIMASLVVI